MNRTKLGFAALTVMLTLALVALVVGCGSTVTTTTAAPSSSSTEAGSTSPTAAQPTSSTAAQGSTSTSAATGPAQTLKVGLITSISGPMATGFKNLADAAKPAADYINSNGGITINGQLYNIEMLAEDDMSAPDGAIAAANKLLGEGVKIIIAPQFTPNNTAIATICENAKVLRIVVHGVDTASYAPPNKYCFGVGTNLFGLGAIQKKVLSLYPQVKSAAILAPDDPGLQAAADIAENDLKGNGLSIAYREAYPLDTQDFNPILTKALATKPDAIDLVAGAPQWAKPIIEGARQMGFTGPIFASAAMGDDMVVSGMLDPKYATDFAQQMMDVSSSAVVPEVTGFAATINAAGLKQYYADHVNVLEALTVLKQGLEKAQSLDTDAVTSAMESMQFDTVYGPGKFAGKDTVAGINIGQNRLMLAPVPFSRLMNGKWEFEWLPAPTN